MFKQNVIITLRANVIDRRKILMGRRDTNLVHLFIGEWSATKKISARVTFSFFMYN